jgi:alpha-glucosidase/alpha-D-xyloside xylohydrolase
MGPREFNNPNAPIPADDRRNILESELENPAIEPVARKYAELRYQLMPYTYSLAWDARESGLPLMRALWLHYPNDTIARRTGDEFLWGRDLLVAPVYRKGATSRVVYLPAGDWYDWWSGERVSGGRTLTRSVDLATMPIFVRAGAIVPVDPIRQYTGETVAGNTTLRVYRGADGVATLYDDDGISQDYLGGRGTTQVRLTWADRDSRLTLEPVGGMTGSQPRNFDVVLLPDGARRTVSYSGRRVVLDLK